MRARRRGAALPLALVALVLLELVVAALWAAAEADARAGRVALATARVDAAADGALALAIATWDTAAADALTPGAVLALPSRSWGGGVVASAEVERRSWSLFEVRAGAELVRGGVPEAARRAAVLVRRHPGGNPGVEVLQEHAWRWLE